MKQSVVSGGNGETWSESLFSLLNKNILYPIDNYYYNGDTFLET